MSYEILNKINSPADVKALAHDRIEPLCSEIRDFISASVRDSGGHLASNLGVVELSVAIHRVFDSPKDHIIFDVGHQAYVHKLLTGRRKDFDQLRTPGGLSGFTLRRESEHDPFGAGHSSTSISAALGFAESDRLLGNDSYTLAVVGDGAFTGGMIHEAINNCKPDLRLVVVLNENGMSISSNKGAFASYISNFRTSKRYIDAKKNTKSILSRIPLIGNLAYKAISGLKETVKRLIYKTNYFEDLGFYYIGVVDGNNYTKVEKALQRAKELEKCVVVHVKTKKGKGVEEAENSPEKFHSIAKNGSKGSTFHSEFADELIGLAESCDDVVAVTAAMGKGTGLSEFEDKHPERYFDVGIAEPHALTFSAGLAANGLKPFTAIYSTFLQRGYDNVIHDIALQNLPVKMFIDRAGLAVSDGATHHGIFDVAFLSHIPGVQIIAPADYEALRQSVAYAYSTDDPIAVRYPNATESSTIKEHFVYRDSNIGVRFDFDIANPPKNLFITYGAIAENVIDAQSIISSHGIDVGIILVETIKPYEAPVSFIKSAISTGTHIVYVEEGIRSGGAAVNTMDLLLSDNALDGVKYEIAAINDNFASPTQPCDLYDYVGLSSEKIAAYFIGEE